LNAPKTAAAFREEVNIPASFDDATRKKYEGLLEKKWTSVVRLQKKVTYLDFESATKWLMPAGPRARAAEPESSERT
jgi:platelet-activating factor acetylhydrolase IB subunit alpha